MKKNLYLCFLLSLISLTIISSGCGRNNRNGNNDQETNIRFLNAVSNASSLDFFLDNKLYLQDVGYLENTSYSKESTQSQKLQVTISGTATRLVDTTLGFGDQRDSSIIISGTKNDSSLIVTRDDNSPASDNIAKIRFINLAYSYDKVDIYIVGKGQSIATLDPSFEKISYKRVSTYIVLDEGSYTVILTEAGSKAVVAQSTSSAFNGASVTTIIAADTKGGIKPAKLLLLTDKK
jgi:hypothetical protein